MFTETSTFLQRSFQGSQRVILSTDLKTVAFINLACVHEFLLEKGAQVVKLKSRPIFWTQMNIGFFIWRSGGSVRLTLHRIAIASKGLWFTHDNGNYGSVSVTKRSCTTLISKVNPHILGRFLYHSLTQCESAAQLHENSESRRQNAIFFKPFSRRREDEWNGIFSN